MRLFSHVPTFLHHRPIRSCACWKSRRSSTIVLSVLLRNPSASDRHAWSAVCDQERSASAPTSCFEHVRGYLWRADPLSLRSRSESDIRLHVCSGEDCANAQISGRVVTRRVPTPRSMRHLCRVRAYTCANIRPASDADAARRRSDQRAIQRGRRPLSAAPSSKKSPTLVRAERRW